MTEVKDIQSLFIQTYPEYEEIRLRSDRYWNGLKIAVGIASLFFVVALIPVFTFAGILWTIGMFVFFTIYCMIANQLTLKRHDLSVFFNTIKKPFLDTLLKTIDPSFIFIDGSIPFEDVMQTKLFNPERATPFIYKGEDYFSGYYKGVRIRISEIAWQLNDYQQADSDFETSVLVLIDFNKNISSNTFIYPQNSKHTKPFSIIAKPIGEEVTLENTDFENSFSTYSDDEIEARFILSHSFMERLLILKSILKRNIIHINFSKNTCSILIHKYTLFELSTSKSLQEDKPFERFYNEVKSIIELIDVLRLNEKIWKE